jgi:glutamate formiminotransferase
MKKITITLIDTPTDEDPNRVTLTAECDPKPAPDAPMSPAMCMAAAVLEFIEAHIEQDKQEQLAEQMPEGIPPHLN